MAASGGMRHLGRRSRRNASVRSVSHRAVRAGVGAFVTDALLVESRATATPSEPSYLCTLRLQSFVARLESTAADARVSTVERYPGSLGCVVQYHLVPLDQSADEPTVVLHEISSVSKGV